MGYRGRSEDAGRDGLFRNWDELIPFLCAHNYDRDMMVAALSYACDPDFSMICFFTRVIRNTLAPPIFPARFSIDSSIMHVASTV